MRSSSIHGAASEFSNASLGDHRLDQRLASIVDCAVTSPAASFPKMVRSAAEREALYRFVENDRINWSSIVEPHYEATADRCREEAVVRVAHDTTWFTFEGNREGLGPIARSRRRGFAGHFSLSISVDDRRAPLGVLAVSSYVRPEKPIARTKQLRAASHLESRLKAREDKESVRWMDGVHAAEHRIGSQTACIHVMDQEADNFAILADLVHEQRRFVVRGSIERRLEPVGTGLVSDALEAATAKVFRTVPLAARSKPRGANPAREERTAELMIQGTALVIRRPEWAQHTARQLPLNVVHVFEPAPPDDVEPVRWVLYTTEPINTIAALTAVVDHYRARWRIEEYFKALKTGCGFEKRQLTSYPALLRALALLAPIAWHLCAIRTVARDASTRPASDLVDDVQLDVLRMLSPSTKLPKKSTTRDVMRAIANIGGHLPQNGEPGWLVLGRGYEDFAKAEAVWRVAIASATKK